MKIRSALIAICLGWMLALAPIAIQQFSNLRPARWLLTRLEDQLVPTPHPQRMIAAATPKVAVISTSAQISSVLSITTNLVMTTPSLPTVAKAKDPTTAQTNDDIDSSSALSLTHIQDSNPPIQVSTPLLTDTVTSLQPIAQVVDNVLPTATATHTPSPTAAPLPNRADLQIRQSAAPDPVEVGALLTYTLQIENPGPGIAQNVLVQNTLPNGLLFEGAASLSVRWGKEPTLSLKHNELTGTVESLRVGGVITITAPVRVRSNLALTTVLNQTTVSSTTPDDRLVNNLATVSVALSRARLANNSYLPVVHK